MVTGPSDFLQGGGQTGQLIRSIDWSASCLGIPQQWPLPLKMAIRSMLHTSVPTYITWGPDFIQFYNDPFIPSFGPTRHPLAMGKPAKATSQMWEFSEPLLSKVMAGESVKLSDAKMMLDKNGVPEECHLDIYYSPIHWEDGSIGGIHSIVIETTDKVNDKNALEESRTKLNFAINAAELGTWELDPTTYKFTGNGRLKEWFGLPPDEEIDLKSATDIIAEKDRTRVAAAIENALQISSGGNYDIEYTIVHRHTKKEIIVKAKGKALFDQENKPYLFSGTLQDVTGDFYIRKQLQREIEEQKKIQARLQESELFASSVIYNSPIATMVFTGPQLTISIINENMLNILGRDNSIIGKPFFEVMPELAGNPVTQRLTHVFETGETYVQPEEKLEFKRYGMSYTGYYSYVYKVLREVSGKIYGLLVTAAEVTSQVVARNHIEAKEKELRDLITASPIGICVVRGRPVWAEEVNDRFLTISGKTREQYQNAPYWEVLSEVAPMFEAILENVFQTGIRFTSQEHEMTLIRDGVPDMIFATFEYIPVVDLNNTVTKVIIMVIEVTHQVEVRKKIEDAVIEQTRELADSNISLKRSNAELEQFAYIASHDLQEPVRKISTFTQILERSLPVIPDDSKKYFEKIYSSADRMTKLIRDVLAFSQVTQDTDDFVPVDLSSVMKTIETDYEISIQEKQATIIIENLPIVNADLSQMTQLFSNLVSNSLKFISPGTKPVITVSSAQATADEVSKHAQLIQSRKYHHIVFRDNGIGFDQEQADKIFKIFQRLHGKTEYGGTGIGLSICRKIVQSHQGHISAASQPNSGTQFHILLPEMD